MMMSSIGFQLQPSLGMSLSKSPLGGMSHGGLLHSHSSGPGSSKAPSADGLDTNPYAVHPHDPHGHHTHGDSMMVSSGNDGGYADSSAYSSAGDYSSHGGPNGGSVSGPGGAAGGSGGGSVECDHCHYKFKPSDDPKSHVCAPFIASSNDHSQSSNSSGLQVASG